MMMEEQNRKTKQMVTRQRQTAVRSLAPEDVAPGMYVTVMRCVIERLPSPYCDDATVLLRGVQRYEVQPPWAGMPLRVVGVCLPFVLVQRADGEHWTLDVRRHALARLSDRYGAEAFARYAADEAASAAKHDDDD